ncbi:MAG TPA: DUF1080 domain-containing protein [Tepidisphaeraceae bacterium]|jgi:hypothetical protein|nr:DUF1080 domain-containing protein [Tepidisphaeraceae bacterium]
MKSRIHSTVVLTTLFAAFALASLARGAEAGNPFVGNWALTLPNGAAGWLGIRDEGGKLTGRILWGGGSVLPVDSVKVEGNQLIVTRNHEGQKQAGGKSAKAVTVETITATLEGDDLKLTSRMVHPDGKETGKAEFTGKRTPPVPPAPDLSKVKFGEPISLFNGKDLTGWRLIDPKAANGWSVKDGVLNNSPVQEPGKPHKHYGNLRTDREFEDFNLTLETNVPPASNSGVYLRGIYEVQILDSYGKPVDSHNMGAIYSRITPSEAAEKPAGQWQTLDITLVDRHATVILNGKKIIDNQPLEGCTGGALWSDQFRPGPIYLQGDHSGANYRNLVLRPVVK